MEAAYVMTHGNPKDCPWKMTCGHNYSKNLTKKDYWNALKEAHEKGNLVNKKLGTHVISMMS